MTTAAPVIAIVNNTRLRDVARARLLLARSLTGGAMSLQVLRDKWTC